MPYQKFGSWNCWTKSFKRDGILQYRKWEEQKNDDLEAVVWYCRWWRISFVYWITWIWVVGLITRTGLFWVFKPTPERPIVQRKNVPSENKEVSLTSLIWFLNLTIAALRLRADCKMARMKNCKVALLRNLRNSTSLRMESISDRTSYLFRLTKTQQITGINTTFRNPHNNKNTNELMFPLHYGKCFPWNHVLVNRRCSPSAATHLETRQQPNSLTPALSSSVL